MKKIIIILLVIATTLGFTSCKTLPQDSSSVRYSHGIIPKLETESSEPSSTEDATVSNESINHSTSTTSSAQKPSVDSSTNSSATLSFGENTVGHPISGLPFKCLADPNTGISWDGVSPIIYTYPDGTTGTEPRVGATYEAMPGITGTIYAPIEPEEYDGRCPDCGKVEGDGTNSTCLQYWAGGGANCDHCGEFVPEDTCHTCG